VFSQTRYSQTPVKRQADLPPMEVSRHKFPIVRYFELSPYRAVKTQWRPNGGWLQNGELKKGKEFKITRKEI